MDDHAHKPTGGITEGLVSICQHCKRGILYTGVEGGWVIHPEWKIFDRIQGRIEEEARTATRKQFSERIHDETCACEREFQDHLGRESKAGSKPVTYAAEDSPDGERTYGQLAENAASEFKLHGPDLYNVTGRWSPDAKEKKNVEGRAASGARGSESSELGEMANTRASSSEDRDGGHPSEAPGGEDSPSYGEALARAGRCASQVSFRVHGPATSEGLRSTAEQFINWDWGQFCRWLENEAFTDSNVLRMLMSYFLEKKDDGLERTWGGD